MDIKSGYVQRHSDLLAILSVVAIVFMVGAGIYYLGESAHVHMRMRNLHRTCVHDVAQDPLKRVSPGESGR